MNILIGMLLFIFVVVALLLVLIILAQDDGTEGAGMIFGSAASQQYGAKKGNVITKTTSVLAAMFIVVAFTLSFLFQWNDKGLTISDTTQNTEGLEWWAIDNEEEQIPLEPTEGSEDKTSGTSDAENVSGEHDSETETPNTEDNNTAVEEPVPAIINTPSTTETMDSN